MNKCDTCKHKIKEINDVKGIKGTVCDLGKERYHEHCPKIYDESEDK